MSDNVKPHESGELSGIEASVQKDNGGRPRRVKYLSNFETKDVRPNTRQICDKSVASPLLDPRFQR